MEENKAFAETIVAEARVRKLLNKFVDEDILPENWSLEEMPIIANALELSINNTLINVFTIVGCLSSLGLGIACQVFLERIEGSSP